MHQAPDATDAFQAERHKNLDNIANDRPRGINIIETQDGHELGTFRFPHPIITNVKALALVPNGTLGATGNTDHSDEFNAAHYELVEHALFQCHRLDRPRRIHP